MTRQPTLCWSLCSVSQSVFPQREEGVRWEIRKCKSKQNLLLLDTPVAPSVPLCVDLRHNYNFDERAISLDYRVHILCLSFK